MRNALSSLWAVFRALFLGVIGQPDGGSEPEAQARKARQRVHVQENRSSGPLQTLGTLIRTVFYAAIHQPDSQPQDGEDSPASRRKPRK
ncbi:Mobile element protein [Deinococcus marmoris]